MNTSILDLTPFIPSDRALEHSPLPDKVLELHKLSAGLYHQLAPQSLATLTRYMADINSYYSNLIEGNATRPAEIRAALRGEYSQDSAQRDLQQESVAHIEVQNWIQHQKPNLDVIFSVEFIKNLHREFYQRIPESLWVIKDSQGKPAGMVKPGEFRTQTVTVGQHMPPEAEDLERLISSFCEHFHPKRFSGERKIVSILAAHHRFAWIHPFLDGNGRVGRLLTDAALKAAGMESYGAWCLSRGLAKLSSRYKLLLANADAIRQGDYDGRGQLTEKGLLEFCDFLLDCALDQARYISDLLNLSQLRLRINAYIQARNDGRVPGIATPIKSQAGLILFNAFIQGEIDRAQALELCAMPERSARRLLSQLKEEGLLSETSSKSPLRWEIPEHAEPWYFPNLTTVF